MKRVICLYRDSTVGQVDHDDIPMQKLACREYAKTHPDWEIVDEISEKGVSGYKVSTNARDAIVEIKRRAAQHQFDVLLVFMFDRLGRREDETPFVVQWFVQQGIEVWSTKEGEQRFDTHVDKLLNYIRFWQASGESEKTAIRVRTKHEQMVMDGDRAAGVIAATKQGDYIRCMAKKAVVLAAQDAQHQKAGQQKENTEEQKLSNLIVIHSLSSLLRGFNQASLKLYFQVYSNPENSTRGKPEKKRVFSAFSSSAAEDCRDPGSTMCNRINWGSS